MIFFLGHGDSNSKNIPTLVKDISNVGQVVCGSSHTIAVSQDGRTVWSFGGGDNGMHFFQGERVGVAFKAKKDMHHAEVIHIE